MSKNVLQKLSTARVKLLASKITKSGKNAHAGFRYFELSDFLPESIKIFNELSLISLFNISSDGTASLSIQDWENGEEVIFTCPAGSVFPGQTLPKKGLSPIQEIGCINTYMKRYLFLNALEISENDFVDATSGANEDPISALNKQYEQLKKIRQQTGAILNKETGVFERSPHPASAEDLNVKTVRKEDF